MEWMQAKHLRKFKDQNENATKWVWCIDDTVLWAETLEDSICQTFIFIQECASEGVIFKKKKFKFACTEVKALVFNLTQEGIDANQGVPQRSDKLPSPKTTKRHEVIPGIPKSISIYDKRKNKRCNVKTKVPPPVHPWLVLDSRRHIQLYEM